MRPLTPEHLAELDAFYGKVGRFVGNVLLLILVTALPAISKTAAELLWSDPISWEGAYSRATYFFVAVIFVFGRWR